MSTTLVNTGTIATGVWHGTVVGSTYGGTGVNNGASTITLGGSLTTSGAFSSTFTMTNTTAVTFPTAGTLATTAQLPSLPLSLANGGTNANLTASNGGIFYSSGTAGAILSGTATAGQLLLSGASTTPAWSTSTYPATNAINTLLYASSANVMSALSTANSGVLITSAGGVPSISSTLPSAVQGNITSVGTVTSGTWSGSTIAIAKGGTNATSFTQSAGIVVYNGTSLVNYAGPQLSSGGIYTNTSQFAFWAFLNTTVSNVTGDGTTYQVICDTKFFDVGSGFSTITGAYTVPAGGTGLWVVGCSICLGGLTAAFTGALCFLNWSGNASGYPVLIGNPGVMASAGQYLSVNGSQIFQVTAADTFTLSIQVTGSTKTINAVGLNAGQQVSMRFWGYKLA